MKHYDYIICGGGMAGLSLAYYLNHSKLNNSSILIIEPSLKNTNDRTWAFWEVADNEFEQIVYRKWKKVRFTNHKNQKKELPLGAYTYKLIRGIGFYTFVQEDLRKNPHIEWLTDKVINLQKNGIVETETSTFSGNYIFDSFTPLNLQNPHNHTLLQHFKGLVIETNTDVFRTDCPDLMDFSIPQTNQECRFMYVLPFQGNRALVEFTLFTEKILPEKEYDEMLEKYIREHLKIDNYRIIEEEFGIIPMSDAKVEKTGFDRLIRIGTAGGYTHPATGYTFLNTQHQLQKLVKALEKTGKPFVQENFLQKRFKIYASIFLNVLQRKRHLAADIFDRMYSQPEPSQVFKFLDSETSFSEDVRLMWKMPKRKFWQAFLDVLARKI